MRCATSILIGAVTLWAGAPAANDKPVWHTDFAAAQEQARREKRPILAVLH
jgi:hypothetical protein